MCDFQNDSESGGLYAPGPVKAISSMTTTMVMTLIMMEMMMICFSKSISTWSSAGHLLKPDHALGLPPDKQGDVQAEGGDQPDVEEDDHKKIPPANLEDESCSTKS